MWNFETLEETCELPATLTDELLTVGKSFVSDGQLHSKQRV